VQLKNRTGIACDQCGAAYNNDFMYYSYDFRPITVANNQRPTREMVLRANTIFSLDVCTACNAAISDKIVRVYATKMSTNRQTTDRIWCELTGADLKGNYNCYQCNITKVDVQISGQPNICASCQERTHKQDQPCEKCGSTSFVRPARTSIDDQFLEFRLSEPAYLEMRTKAETIRKVAGQWATSS
jgi:rRNA maturation protein Nop10